MNCSTCDTPAAQLPGGKCAICWLKAWSEAQKAARRWQRKYEDLKSRYDELLEPVPLKKP